MGSNLVRSDWVKAGDFQSIQNSTQTVLGLIRTIRARE
jgi:hypothetical protein